MATMKDELAMTKGFDTPHDEAFMALIRTSEVVQAPTDAVFRQHKLSSAQYNILRILRGAGDKGCTCGEIDSRLLKRGPDVTRLIDRMKQCGLVTRQRSQTDRRVVRVVLTENGRSLVNSLDQPVQDALEGSMAGLSAEEAQQLVVLLEKLRHPPAQPSESAST